MSRFESGDSIEFEGPTWAGNGFNEAEPNELWLRLPINLREIAISEISAGNRPTCIMENKKSGVVLLEFVAIPFIQRPSGNSVVIHTEHQVGNYCYEGIFATYQDISSGHFLAFKEP